MASKSSKSPAHSAENSQDAGQEREDGPVAERRRKLAALREDGWAYPNNFAPTATSASVRERFGQCDADSLRQKNERVAVAGRIVLKRLMGKAAFFVLQDGFGRIQLYLNAANAGKKAFAQCLDWDLGDIVGVSGALFFTKTGELTVNCDEQHLLSKAVRPLPEKHHGLADQEKKYRQRYLSLIGDEDAREIFRKRSRLISVARKFLSDMDFLEVETPMMQPIPGGAAAKPFVTHHNALNCDLYLRIAPELYLKRLLVGGFDRVFEINRSFRNEGISPQHNPEFTMLEYYMAYGDWEVGISQVRDLIKKAVSEIVGRSTFTYKGVEIDVSGDFARLSPAEVLVLHCGFSKAQVSDRDCLLSRLSELEGDKVRKAVQQSETCVLQHLLFEKLGENKLQQPTFVVDLPAAVSPLSRRRDGDPATVDRFELYMGGFEIANVFSELNDPDAQAEVFRGQAAELAKGKEDAMWYDGDYIRALEHGMPPALGVGVGIDRLTMLLTDSQSIRDVILFPMMRPK